MEQEEQMAMMNYGNVEGPPRGEPIFVYVSKISEDEQLKARAEAFKQAQREASKLAKAAGVELGPLSHLDDQSSPAYGAEESYSFDGNYAYRMQQMMGMLALATAATNRGERPSVSSRDECHCT